MHNRKTLTIILGIVCALTALLCTGCRKAPTEISFDDLRAIVYNATTLAEYTIIDVRPEANYKNGYIQNAVNIDLEDLIDGATGQLIDGGIALTSVVTDKTAKIITYCDGYGKDLQFANTAADLGYTHVQFYAGGTAEWWDTEHEFLVKHYDAFKSWFDNHYPFDDGDHYLISANLASWYTGEEIQDGHIPCAINICNDDVIASTNDDGTVNLLDSGSVLSAAVPDLDSKLIIYCGSMTCGRSLALCKAAVDMGYARVWRYQGGYNTWIAEGNAYTAGSTPCPAD